MADERLTAGVERIERALARISAAAASGPRPIDGDALHALRARHEGLKAEVSRVLDELDALARG